MVKTERVRECRRLRRFVSSLGLAVTSEGRGGGWIGFRNVGGKRT